MSWDVADVMQDSLSSTCLTSLLSPCQPSCPVKALEFFKASPEYSPSMSITAKYNTHFASQYREKVGRQTRRSTSVVNHPRGECFADV